MEGLKELKEVAKIGEGTWVADDDKYKITVPSVGLSLMPGAASGKTATSTLSAFADDDKMVASEKGQQLIFYRVQ